MPKGTSIAFFKDGTMNKSTSFFKTMKFIQQDEFRRFLLFSITEIETLKAKFLASPLPATRAAGKLRIHHSEK